MEERILAIDLKYYDLVVKVIFIVDKSFLSSLSWGPFLKKTWLRLFWVQHVTSHVDLPKGKECVSHADAITAVDVTVGVLNLG